MVVVLEVGVVRGMVVGLLRRVLLWGVLEEEL